MTNDEKILKVQKLIEEKKSKISKISKFYPETSMNLTIDNISYNLNVLSVNELKMLLIRLNMFKMSSENLNMKEDVIISGFPLSSWMKDISGKLEYKSILEENNKLKTLEDKLSSLLSQDKKIEIEIENIENLIK